MCHTYNAVLRAWGSIVLSYHFLPTTSLSSAILKLGTLIYGMLVYQVKNNYADRVNRVSKPQHSIWLTKAASMVSYMSHIHTCQTYIRCAQYCLLLKVASTSSFECSAPQPEYVYVAMTSTECHCGFQVAQPVLCTCALVHSNSRRQQKDPKTELSIKIRVFGDAPAKQRPCAQGRFSSNHNLQVKRIISCIAVGVHTRYESLTPT